jgi:purine-binding chemotaxis protein CheW
LLQGTEAATVQIERRRPDVGNVTWEHLRLPPFPQVALRVLQLANKENVQMHQLSDLISSDPAFASEVLTIANSLLYAPRFPSKSIQQAIVVLGINNLQGMCLTVGARAYMGKAMHLPFMQVNRILAQISNGKIDELIAQTYKGDHEKMKLAVNNVAQVLQDLHQELARLTEASNAGKLAERGHHDQFRGAYAEIVRGVNAILDAVIVPLNVSAKYVEQISKGDNPPLITDTYNGDFNLIKNNLNTLVTAMNEITSAADEIANGNLTVELRERSPQDKLMQALAAMVGGLTRTVSDIRAIAGEVSAASQSISTASIQVSKGASAQAAAAEEASSSMEEMVTFKLGNEIFATDVAKVREVLDLTTITAIPRTPDFMSGVINLRGSVVPVVDLRLCFEMSKTESTRNTCIVVVEVLLDNESTVIGALADSVEEVIDLEPDQIQPAPRIGTQIRTDFIKGMGRRDTQFIMILDIDRVFSAEKLAVVRGQESNKPLMEVAA